MTRNKEQLNEWNRKYYEKRKNEPVYKEKRRISAKKYYQTHRKKCIKARLDYFLKNKEKYRKYRREWRYLTPAGIYMTIKGSVKHRKNNYLFQLQERIL